MPPSEQNGSASALFFVDGRLIFDARAFLSFKHVVSPIFLRGHRVLFILGLLNFGNGVKGCLYRSRFFIYMDSTNDSRGNSIK